MVHIEEDGRLIIEMDCGYKLEAMETWEQLVQMLLTLIQNEDEDLAQRRELFMAVELLRALLPRFDKGEKVKRWKGEKVER